MALTQPSYEFGGAVPTVWGQEITANIPQLVDGIVELGKRPDQQLVGYGIRKSM